MTKILFICHGNICRSPMAEYILKDMIKENNDLSIYVESRATSREEIWNGKGNSVYPPAKKELLKHHITCDEKRAQQITIKDCEEYDYLICMDQNNLRNMKNMFGNKYIHKTYLLLEFAGIHKDVADPWYTGNFTKTYQDILVGIQGLLKYLKTK